MEILSENKIVLLRPESLLESRGILREEIEALKAEGYSHVLLDLLHLQWVNSTDIAIIFVCYKSLLESNIALSLLVGSSVLKKTLETTGIDAVSPIYESREQALAVIQQETNPD